MADTITTSQYANFELYFVDGDTRTLTVNNTGSGLSAAAIGDLNTFIQTNNLLIGDRAGATFGKISKVTRVDQTTTKVEL